MASPVAILKKARDRKRRRCNNETTYSHENLAEWLKAGLPAGWRVETPPAWAVAPSGFPISNDREAQAALQQLLPVLPTVSRGYEDELDGHCETVSVVLSERVVQELRSPGDRTPAQILACAYDDLAKELRAATVPEQVRTLFAPMLDAPSSSAEWWKIWLSLMGTTAAQVPPGDFLAGMCAGVTPTLLPRLTDTIREAKEDTFALPLYVLSYIWDGDELGAADLKEDIETAQYSIHCIGLVVHCQSRTAYLADPNGALLKGGSTEFIKIPFTRLSGCKPTTAVSRWDRDQANVGPCESPLKTENAIYLELENLQSHCGSPQKRSRNE